MLTRPLACLKKVLLPTPDVLLDVVLHGAPAPAFEESTTTHFDEHVVPLVLKKHRLPDSKPVALSAVGPSTSSFVVDGIGHVLDDEGFQVFSRVPSRAALTDRRCLEERLRHRLRVTFSGLEDTSPFSGGSGTVVDELILSVLPVGGHP